MEDNQEQEERSAMSWMLGLVAVGLLGGFFCGREYQQKQDKDVVTIGTWVATTMTKLEFAVHQTDDPANFYNTYELSRDNGKVEYIEFHIFSTGRAIADSPVPSIKVDVGNPEKDGEVPNKDADNWVKKHG